MYTQALERKLPAMNRRAFTRDLVASGLGALGMTVGCSTRVPVHPPPPPGPVPNPVTVNPDDSGIEHIVIVTLENRSFDHFLGWLPGAAGIPSGLSFKDASGAVHPVYALNGDYTGCGHPIPDNSYGTPNITAYDAGAMDGFLRVPGNDIYSIGYYGAPDLPFLAALAQTYITCDHWFAPILAETFPNRIFLLTAQTDRLSNTLSLSGLPTIFDGLAKAGVSHRYYFGNIPFLALWGLKYLSSSSDFDDFLADARSGTLPAVSFVDPKFTELDDGLGNDDHPHSDIRNGDAFLSQVFHAVSTGPKWSSTVLIVTFDEWGGFFDHVPPPRVIAPNNVDTNLVNGEALLGFRVPTVIASPFTRRANKVDSTVYDHTAILKLIEWRWSLSPLTLRDASRSIGNPVVNFNFSSPDASIPQLPQPATVPALPCLLRGLANRAESPGVAQTPPATEFRALHQSQPVRDWLNNPRFQRAR
ncbi:MAG: alkaline phosphatase family protein [Acidobacteriaceae bacterium]|nr:alkaline phosphatase family protein [Acidobacteriaceae bacterium]